MNLDQSPGKMTIDPNLDHDETKAPNRPAMDLDDNNDMKGFKKASKALTAYGKEQKQAEMAKANINSA